MIGQGAKQLHKFSIGKIIFKDNTEFIPSNLNVIVGPNNSGKSRILKDICELVENYPPNINTVLIKNIEYRFPNSIKNFIDFYNIKPFRELHGNYSIYTYSSNLTKKRSIEIPSDIWNKYCSGDFKISPNGDNIKINFFEPFFITLLRTEDRLNMVNRRILHSDPQSNGMETSKLLELLYDKGSNIEKMLSDKTIESFGIDIKLDFTVPCILQFKIGDKDRFSSMPPDPRDSKAILSKFENLDDQGDGIKSYVAIVATILLKAKPILMIDEPEAFLYPAQARRLGELIAIYSVKDHQSFIVTHSSDLLRGIINNVQEDIKIIRVDRICNSNKITYLYPADLEKIYKDPLLNSSRVLDALFYKGVIIVEGDSDSLFYQNISRKIGVSEDIHYVHAQNKQTIGRIISAYQKLEIRFSAIVDFDILRNFNEFQSLLEEATASRHDIDKIKSLREDLIKEINIIDSSELLEYVNKEIIIQYTQLSNLKSSEDITISLRDARDKFHELETRIGQSSNWDQFKKHGIKKLSEEGKTKFYYLDELSRKYGIFIVPVGGLESWLMEYGVGGRKSEWIAKALAKLDSIEVNLEKQPWKFIKEIHDHLLK